MPNLWNENRLYFYCCQIENTSTKHGKDGKESNLGEQCWRRRLELTGRRLMVSERVPPTQKGRSGCGAVDLMPTRSRPQPPHGVSKQRVSQRTSRSRRLTIPLSYHFEISSLQGSVRRRISVLNFVLFRNTSICRVLLTIRFLLWNLFTQYSDFASRKKGYLQLVITQTKPNSFSHSKCFKYFLCRTIRSNPYFIRFSFYFYFQIMKFVFIICKNTFHAPQKNRT